MRLPYLTLPVRLALFFVMAVFIADWALAAGFERSFTFDSYTLEVENLVGQVQVVPASGDDFKVTVKVQGQDASEDLLEFLVEEGSKTKMKLAFPIDEHTRYVYPALGRNSKTTVHHRDYKSEEGSWLKKVFNGFGGTKIEVRGHGKGLEMWADLVIEVPEGSSLNMRQTVGGIDAADVEADLVLDTGSGAISGMKIKGDFSADTGSGSVEAESIIGRVHIDTGSGNVAVALVEGEKVLIDTGSGRVDVEKLRCDSLNIDTGSGKVVAQSIITDEAIIDTGSGGVSLQLDGMGTGKYMIDTGSGGITLSLPDDASAEILVDTGSGRIENQLTGASILHKDRGELKMTVGEGEARVVLDAGSGSVTIK